MCRGVYMLMLRWHRAVACTVIALLVLLRRMLLKMILYQEPSRTMHVVQILATPFLQQSPSRIHNWTAVERR